MATGEPHESLVGVVAGAYRIEAQIGRGGMGEVYRATHERLGHTVAVKSIRADLEQSGKARERFVREIRMACSVSHPYVATVFDVVEHGDRLMLVMEYVDGKPLSRVLLERPDPQEVVRWSVEIAEALAAIHHAGLVHRDIKPGNVMVAADGHVKVMDFGLARPLPPLVADDGTTVTMLGSLTDEGARVGTPKYMSPEQLRGEELDPRSDLFSYGILLYETLTGVHPFDRSTVVESLSAIINDTPVGGELPHRLSGSDKLRQILDRSLAKAPEDRYQSADEALGDLRALSRDMVAPAGRTRTLVTALGIAVAVVLAVSGAGYWWLAQPASWDRPRLSLAIAPFEMRNDDDEIAGVMVADLLATDLAASSVVRALGPGRTEPVLRNLRGDLGTDAVGAALSRALSVDYVLVGQIYREDQRLIAAIEFPQLRSDEPSIRAVRVEASSYRELAERAATAVRRHLPDVPLVTAWRDDRLDISTILSDSEEAQRAFQLGQRDLALERPAAAIDHFEEAVAFDDGFALAHARLAEALSRAGYSRRARESAARALTLVPAGEDRATRRLRLTVQAIHDRAFDRGEDEIESTAELTEMFPDEASLLAMHATALRRNERFAEALARFDLALAIEPGNASARLGRISALRLLGRHDEALAEGDRTEALLSAASDEEALAALELVRGKIRWDLEEFAVARERLIAAADRFSAAGREISAADALLEAAKLDVKLGHIAVADEPLEQALVIADSSGNLMIESDVHSVRGVQAIQRGDFAGAERSLRHAVDIARQLENDALLVDPLTNLAGILVYDGRLDEARPMLDELADLTAALGREDAEAAVLMNKSGVDARLGYIEAAIEALERMLELSAGSPPDQVEARAHRELAIYRHSLGDPAAALAAATTAVESARRLSLPADLAWSLIVRAEIFSSIGDSAGAQADIGAAREFIEAPGSDLRELAVRGRIARARLLADRGGWVEMATWLDELPGGESETGERSAARLLGCRARVALERYADARSLCTSVADDQQLPLAVRVAGRAYLAEALLGDRRIDQARAMAEKAYRQAEGIGLRLVVAHAAATLVDASAGESSRLDPEYARSGLEALEAFASSASSIAGQDYVPSVEIREWCEILDGC